MKLILLAVAITVLAGTSRDGFAQVAEQAGGTPVSATTAEAPQLTDKQKLLAEEADKLVGMANELKVQVDKTSKNILSMTVVEKAAEIEAYAHQIKLAAKK